MAQMAGNGSLDGATLHGCVGLVRGRLSAGRLRFTKGREAKPWRKQQQAQFVC